MPVANQNEPERNNAPQSVIAYLLSNKIELALWITRLITIVFSICFVLPITGVHPYSAYQKTLISSAATSALRLHQRVPHFQLSRAYFNQIFMEDSAHYLVYCLIFMTSNPVSIAIIPLFLYALLHAQNYTKQLLNQIGPNTLVTVRNLLGKIDSHQVNILRAITSIEIFIMPLSILSIFTGQGSLLLPFLYYRFITMRYLSRRNPYCRQIFYELNCTTQELISRPQCPNFIRLFIQQIIFYISKLAPVAIPTQN